MVTTETARTCGSAGAGDTQQPRSLNTGEINMITLMPKNTVYILVCLDLFFIFFYFLLWIFKTTTVLFHQLFKQLVTEVCEFKPFGSAEFNDFPSSFLCNAGGVCGAPTDTREQLEVNQQMLRLMKSMVKQNTSTSFDPCCRWFVQHLWFMFRYVQMICSFLFFHKWQVCTQ